MVKENYERKLQALNGAVDSAKRSVDQGRYAAAIGYVDQARGMMKGGNYRGLLTEKHAIVNGELNLIMRHARDQVRDRLEQGYKTVDNELARISKGGMPTPKARRTLAEMSGYVDSLTGTDMPKSISKEFTPDKTRVDKLKKELEALATSKGGKIDWAKP
ncbi:MAG: hypothetical protein HYT71_01305 [Candidatus Aenigmarchaeota archaeon]|nr:hypothetical protein [Candidatus Aenigmarchaeota archaeon]